MKHFQITLLCEKMFLKISFISPFRWGQNRSGKRKASYLRDSFDDVHRGYLGDYRGYGGYFGDRFDDETSDADDCAEATKGEKDVFDIIKYRREAEMNASLQHRVDSKEIEMKHLAISNFNEDSRLLDASSLNFLSFQELKFPSIKSQHLDSRFITNKCWTTPQLDTCASSSLSTVLRVKYVT